MAFRRLTDMTRERKRTPWISKDAKWTIGMIVAAVAIPLGFTKGCNMACNNQTIDRPGLHSESHDTGLVGHEEFTRYKDGSCDVKVYPGLGHRLWESKLYQDLDGDGLVDRIRVNGGEIVANRLSDILVREHDYAEHQEEFDEADQKLQELIAKYPARE